MSVSGQPLRPHVTESYVDGEWPDELLIEQNHVVPRIVERVFEADIQGISRGITRDEEA